MKETSSEAFIAVSKQPTPPKLRFDLRQLDYHQLLPRPQPPNFSSKRHSPSPPPQFQFTSPFAHQAQKHYENWTPQQNSSKHDVKDRFRQTVRNSLGKEAHRNEKGYITDEQRQIYEHLGIQLHTNRGKSSPHNHLRPNIQQNRESRSHKNTADNSPNAASVTQQMFFKQHGKKQSPRQTPIMFDDLASTDEDAIQDLYNMKKFYTNRRFDFIKFFEKQTEALSMTGQKFPNPKVPTPPPMISGEPASHRKEGFMDKRKKLSSLAISNFLEESKDAVFPTQGGQGVQRNQNEHISKTEHEYSIKPLSPDDVKKFIAPRNRKLTQRRGEKLQELRETAKLYIDRLPVDSGDKALSATMPKVSGKNLKVQKAQIEHNIVKVQKKVQISIQKRADNTYEPLYPQSPPKANGLDIFVEQANKTYQASKFKQPKDLPSVRNLDSVRTSNMPKRVNKLEDGFERVEVEADSFEIQNDYHGTKASPMHSTVKPASQGRPFQLFSLPHTPQLPIGQDRSQVHIDRKKRFAELMQFSCESDIQVLHNRINLLHDPKQGQASQTTRGGYSAKDGFSAGFAAFNNRFAQKKAVSFCLPPVTPTPKNQAVAAEQPVIGEFEAKA